MSAGLSVLPVDDPRRPFIRRAVFGTLWAAGTFFVFATTKDVKPIYDHAPWLNDPYDTATSFTMFFVPLVTACLLVQVSLCPRSEPLSLARVVTILRACRVVLGAIAVDLASAWVALAVGANNSQWALGTTGLEVGLLGVATSVTTMVVVHLVRVPPLPKPVELRDVSAPDWIGDAVTVVRRESRWFGPLRRLVLGTTEWADRDLVHQLRRHPIAAAAIASAVFGATVFGWQGYREAYFLSVTLLAMGLGSCAMFAFLVPAGAYLGLVRSSRPSYGVQRRLLDSSVAAGAAAIVALAFRNSLWSAVGSNPTATGPSRLATLAGGVMLLIFIMVVGAETLLGSHSRPGQRLRADSAVRWQ